MRLKKTYIKELEKWHLSPPRRGYTGEFDTYTIWNDKGRGAYWFSIKSWIRAGHTKESFVLTLKIINYKHRAGEKIIIYYQKHNKKEFVVKII